MSSPWNQVPGQLVFPGAPQPSARVLRAMRRGPKIRMSRIPRPAAAERAERAAGEWHEMSPGQQFAEWAALRAWVAWLHDRYELSADDKLPACWPAHPGLIEELYALKVWREEIYGASQLSGQAARYWHAELRQVIQAAATVYAVGCRTGHRPAPRTAAGDPALRAQWATLSPLTGISEPDLAGSHTRDRPRDRHRRRLPHPRPHSRRCRRRRGRLDSPGRRLGRDGRDRGTR
jgi:hypothetical protein